MEPDEPEKQTMLDSETMLLSPIHAAAPRPRTVTCISAPDDSSPGSPRERDAFSVSRPRSKSVRMKNQAGIVRHGRSNSIVSKSGRRIYKNLGRMYSVDHDPEDFQTTVRLFRLNSFVKDTGRKEDAEAEPERQQWDDPMEFLMSCISMSVGLGNVWRFPFTAYENGGGAFLIPYICVLMLVGRPLYFMELALGQFSSAGCVNVWDMIPALGGVGYGQILGTACVTTYYCSLIALSIYYLVVSCYPVLPWTVCHDHLQSEDVSSPICIPSGANISEFITCYHPNITELNSTRCVSAARELDTLTEETANVSIISSAEQYFRVGVLKEKTDISQGLGLPDPTLAGCLAVCWLLLYLTLRKGVSSSGKVAYFTALFPYVVMIALLIRGLTLPGASQGLLFFFTPQWEKLASLQVWYAAVTQSFFSLSVGFGTLTTYSSYNKFRHNTNKDALIISFADTFTSLLAGTVIFSILGHLAHELDLPVAEVVKSGAGLAFVSYPEVLAKFDFVPQVFAVLFFLMLITLGLGSAVGFISAVTTTIYDSFPDVDQKFILKICCFVGYGIGLFYVTPGGQIMLEMVDYYGGTVLILALVSVEVIAINWVYGTNQLARDFNFMLRMQLSVYWRFCWGILCPLLLPLLFLYVLFTQAGVPDIPFPAQVAGWIISLIGIVLVPTHILLSVCGDTETESDTFISKVIATIKQGQFGHNFKNAFLPNNQWGPCNIEEKKDWQIYCEEVDLYQWLPKIIRRKLRSQQSPAQVETPT